VIFDVFQHLKVIFFIFPAGLQH